MLIQPPISNGILIVKGMAAGSFIMRLNKRVKDTNTRPAYAENTEIGIRGPS
jgi:hypothetical protein